MAYSSGVILVKGKVAGAGSSQLAGPTICIAQARQRRASGFYPFSIRGIRSALQLGGEGEDAVSADSTDGWHQLILNIEQRFILIDQGTQGGGNPTAL